ncbi:MAG: hypothetical protein LC797_17440 [Chloroflexi bacterium]|nr:hypothetical protein [Chloroflexota bacterium]
MRVALVLGAHSINGTVFVDGGATDPVVFFLRGLEKSTERFLAVTSAHIAAAATGVAEDIGMAIVNRSAIRVFSASAASSGEQKSSPQTA